MANRSPTGMSCTWTDWVQIDLLKEEGIFIDQDVKIHLRKYLWKSDLYKDWNRR
ncbi:hypothetical protein [Prochlorococcus sp. MIT 1307]|uniref:hypothetical protein n=1 Tax=Prochlorococcus sp. MIT 1307 TaxID=3096219 RepID=UPI002A75843A|nr:hypothetical protein [Prochlorococcus sp. MIT 1307]